MVKLLFFCFWVNNSRLQIKKFHFELLTRWDILIFSLSSYKREVDKWKKFLKYYNLTLSEPLEIGTTP